MRVLFMAEVKTELVVIDKAYHLLIWCSGYEKGVGSLLKIKDIQKGDAGRSSCEYKKDFQNIHFLRAFSSPPFGQPPSRLGEPRKGTSPKPTIH
jgi:hypothetical protein